MVVDFGESVSCLRLSYLSKVNCVASLRTDAERLSSYFIRKLNIIQFHSRLTTQPGNFSRFIHRNCGQMVTRFRISATSLRYCANISRTIDKLWN